MFCMIIGMMIKAVFNGYAGNTTCAVLVEAETDEEALETAAKVFARSTDRAAEEPSYYTPGPNWSVETVQLPRECEFG